MSTQRAIDFILNFARRDIDLMIKGDSLSTAYMGAKYAVGQDVAGLQRYLDQEFRMQVDNIRKRGYASIFIMSARGESVLHLRVGMSAAHGWEVSYLD